MKAIKKIAGINLVIALVYSIWARLSPGSGEEQIGIIILLAFVIGIHGLINILLGIGNFARGNNEVGKAYIISSGIVLIIGFSTCVGGSVLF